MQEILEQQPETAKEAVDLLLRYAARHEGVQQDLEEHDRRNFGAIAHHGAGRAIRNEWGLWLGHMAYEGLEYPSTGEVPDPVPLYDHLREEHGIEHPDAQSGFLLREMYDRYHETDQYHEW